MDVNILSELTEYINSKIVVEFEELRNCTEIS